MLARYNQRGKRLMEGAEPTADLVDRLAVLPDLRGIPREELQWLVDHGDFEVRPAGKLGLTKGQPVNTLSVVLSGRISIHVDRGVGPRRVLSWETGAVTGKLPYSRMKGSPGDNYTEEESELLTVHERHFPEMVHRCPRFTTHTVHLMLDRARRFNASDLQDEKMISLGKLAAGLAHELNNPSSATVRGAKRLPDSLAEADAASRYLGAAGLTPKQLELVERLHSACLSGTGGDVLSPIERADREEELADWLARHGCELSHAERLVDTRLRLDVLDELEQEVSGETLGAVLRWLAADCEIRSLAADIERAATQIHELVAAVRRFTQMDSRAAPEAVDVATGLRDTIRVITSKAREKGATLTLDVESDLPRVRANAGELNQVWSNLIDNALDAIAEAGRVEVSARQELDRVVVRVVDDGPGISPDVESRIFDAFITTKPPGQGLGLGLEITRRLVRRYQGEIAVDSGPGRTEFRVSLPTERSARAIASDEPA